MRANGKRLFVILLSFAVVWFSGLVTHTVWVSLAGLELLQRGVISLSSWVAAFYLGAYLFWRTIVRVSVAEP